jgi:hypothetical protein
MTKSQIPSKEDYHTTTLTEVPLSQSGHGALAFAALLESKENYQTPKPPESDMEFSWRMTQFLIWPGEHNPALRRQADMGIAIRTSDDDLEALRTS